MYQEINNKNIFKLFIPLNIDSLSSYLTPILAQYNIQYNEFLITFFNDFKSYLGINFDYILISNLIESQPLSKYNLRVRIDVCLSELFINSAPKYQLIYKPLFLNYILLYYFKSCYKKKYALEFINLIKLGLFFWWNRDFNIIKFTKNNYIFLRWFIVLRNYGFKKYSSRLKSIPSEFFTIKYLNHLFLKNKNKWYNIYNYQIKYTFISYKKYISLYNHIYLYDLIHFHSCNTKLMTQYIKNIKLLKKNDKIIIIYLKNELHFNNFISSNIKYIKYKRNIYSWSFFNKNFLINLFPNFNNLIILNILLIYYYFNNFFQKSYAYNKFFIYK